MGSCAFCQVVHGQADASIVYENDNVLSFLTIRQTRDGECLVIPKRHFEHFINLPVECLSEVIGVVQRVATAAYEEFHPDRMGLVVHGYGVPHVHFIVLPQHHEDDITSRQFAKTADNKIVEFDHTLVPESSRNTLDQRARALRVRLNQDTVHPDASAPLQ